MRGWMAVANAIPVALLLSACGGGGDHGGPSAPGASDVRLAAADVLVDGRSVSGQTIPPGSGNSTLFQVRLEDPGDGVRIASMWMRYPMHSSMGMMGREGSVVCYDDGTHGDPVAGDGIYCYRDDDGHVGPHRADCPQGDYTYRFHGSDLEGRSTNDLVCTVTVR